MKKNTVTGIIILMSISLAGIILVQVFWMKNAVEIKEKQFDQAANESLVAAVKALSKHQSVSWVSSQFFTDNSPGKEDTLVVVNDKDENVFVQSKPGQTYTYVISSSESTGSGDKTSHSSVSVNFNSNDKRFLTEKELVDSLKDEIEDDHMIVLTEFTDSVNVIVRKKLSQITNRGKAMDAALNELVYEINTIDEATDDFYNESNITDLLSENLADNGIEIPFEFGVLIPENDSLTDLHSEGFNVSGSTKLYKTRLFPERLFSKSDLLLLSFPDQGMHIFRSLGLLFGGSVLFTLVIIVTFIITIRVILRQKKLSEIKSDFINNMTHEFKTPIATISLAVDSINNARVISDPEKVKYFTRIIGEENKRMNTSVENVLQMSLIDKRDFDFKPERFDFHDLISQVARNMQLQLDQKAGEIELDLKAENTIVHLDRLHFTNVVTNLVDNAIKYAEKPHIELGTTNTDQFFIFSVKDNGRGLSREEKEKVFEKFYRVSSGNIHNVKGFGLGLSYVKAIVLASGGQIEVESKQGEGATFIIKIPQNPNNG